MPEWPAPMTILLALASAVVYGVADYAGGRSTRTNPAAIVALVGQLVSLVLIGAALVIAGTPVADGASLAWGAIGGISGGIGLTAFYHALANGSMAVVAPLTAVVSSVLPVGVGLASGERPKAIAYVGIVVAIVAVALVSGAVGRHDRRTPRIVLAAAVLAGLGFGGLFVGLDRAADDSGVWPLLAARCGSIPLLTALVLVGRSAIHSHRPTLRGLRFAYVAGALDMTANFLYLEATHGGLLSLVAVVSSLYPASTVTLAYLVDRERIHRPQLVGMGLAAVALAFVTLGRG
jgi:drug/metabolite transporter (DMT)-like permease